MLFRSTNGVSARAGARAIAKAAADGRIDSRMRQIIVVRARSVAGEPQTQRGERCMKLPTEKWRGDGDPERSRIIVRAVGGDTKGDPRVGSIVDGVGPPPCGHERVADIR